MRIAFARETLRIVSVAAALAIAAPVRADAPRDGSAGAAAAPAASGAATAPIPAAVRDAVAAPDRSDADRALDSGRKPAELLTFAGVGPGMRVADLAAGSGYTTELLARVVGPSGRVWSENSQFIRDRFAEKPWTERLAKPGLGNVVRVERELDDPLPPDAHDLDAVLLVLFYHDTYWMGVDRAAMNRRIYEALRPGGTYVVVDHSAKPGSGAADVETLHRVEEPLVRKEVLRAGFRLDAESDFLRNPDDARDWNASPRSAGERRGTSDRFALRFVKPGPTTSTPARAPAAVPEP
jgi:predicted methyltransferase